MRDRGAPHRVRERLLVVTDLAVAGGAPALLARLAAALAGAPRGSVLVQLRDKALADDALAGLAGAVAAMCRAHGARWVLNVGAGGRLAGAAALGADGAHLPEAGPTVAAARATLPAGALVGVATHTVDDAVARLAEGADYVTLGPVWATASKPGQPPLGLAALAEAARRAPRGTVFALGGVDDAARAGQAARAGAGGVACIRGVLAASEPGEAAAALVAAVDEARAAVAAPGGPG